MPRDGTATRTKIMDAAEALIMGHGFAATSIDRVVEEAKITKGTFFYHFKTKADLAEALVRRFAEMDLANLDSCMTRAEALSRDPLQQLLIFAGLYKEQADALTDVHPGCLFATYCYEAQLFDEQTLQVAEDTLLTWRRRLGAKIEEVMALYPPRLPMTAEAVADMLTVLFEGAFVLSRTLKEPHVVAEQAGLYRDYLELLFTPDTQMADKQKVSRVPA